MEKQATRTRRRIRTAKPPATEVVNPADALEFVVGIGASAGGLEALRALVPHLPADGRMAFIVAQHMAPQQPSMLTQLLSRDAALQVVQIEDRQPIRPDVIFITPPNSDVELRNGVLHLRRPPAAIGPKPSVDHLFISLAEDQGRKAVAIVLSGTGSDGAQGVRAIKALGGVTFAQELAGAKYAGMPKSAIETGCVEFVMTPGQIGLELASLNRRRRPPPSAPAAEADPMSRILALLRARLGADFTNYKRTTIRRRLERRLAVHHLGTTEEYVAFIEDHPEELARLRDEMLISVTEFFRDQEAFDALATVIPEMLADKKPGDTLRVWVPGCATGEEAYSIAALIATHAGERLQSLHVQIFGTDVDADALARARRGVYPAAAIADLEEGVRQRFFMSEGEDHQVVKSLRDMIVFARHDLIQDPPFLRMDLISCRNLLIYFNPALQAKVFNLFHYALNPGKFLLLGKSESVSVAPGMFRVLDKRWKMFRRSGDYSAGIPEVAARYAARAEIWRDRRPQKEPTLAEQLHGALLAGFVPPSLLVDSDGRILHVYGDVAPYVTMAPGAPEVNVASMLRRELRGEARAAMLKARQSRIAVTGTVLRIGDPEAGEAVRISARPFAFDGDPNLVIVSFEPIRTVDPALAWAGAVGDDNPRIMELEQELAANRENLQTVVEELETSNEELQSLNEELQAANEELQSTNEELETSNEELQSTNEELTTVNDELQIKSGEVAAANGDLENIQTSIGFPLIVVDQDLRLRRFNPSARLLFTLTSESIGQLITSTPCQIDLPDLPSRLRAVIDAGEPHEEQIDQRIGSFAMRITPYVTEQAKRTGAVITFVDNAALRRSEHRLRASEGLFRTMAEAIREVFWLVRLEDGAMIYINTAVEALFGATRDQVCAAPELLFDLADEADRTVAEAARVRLAEGIGVDVEYRIRRPDGAVRWMWLQSFPVVDEVSGQPMMAGIAVDITRIKEDERRLLAMQDELERRVEEAANAQHQAQLASRAKTEFLANMSHELRTPLNAIIGFAETIALEEFGAIGNERYTEYVGIIGESGRHLLQLINDILDVSKIEAGKVDLTEERVPLASVVAAATRLVTERAARNRVSLRTELPPDLPALLCDERRLKQIVVNLMSNAVKFTLAGTVTIAATMAADGAMVITVADTGIGMKPQDIPKALALFGQIDSRLIRRYDGAGLGLPLTKQLVEMHGGSLCIESAVGQGTTASVRFPPERVAANEPVTGGV